MHRDRDTAVCQVLCFRPGSGAVGHVPARGLGRDNQRIMDAIPDAVFVQVSSKVIPVGYPEGILVVNVRPVRRHLWFLEERVGDRLVIEFSVHSSFFGISFKFF